MPSPGGPAANFGDAHMLDSVSVKPAHAVTAPDGVVLIDVLQAVRTLVGLVSTSPDRRGRCWVSFFMSAGKARCLKTVGLLGHPYENSMYSAEYPAGSSGSNQVNILSPAPIR